TLAEIVPGAPSPDYVYANGIRIARTGGTVSTTYYITDALGSTRVVTDTSGRVVVSDNYQPFGSDNTSKGSETYKFTGKPVSATTGLYYEYSRWYDPSIGRFISQDPSAGHVSDPQSLNAYVYVENLPTVMTDPTGAVLCDGNQDCEGGGLLRVQPLTQEQLNSIEDPQIREICGDNPLICRAMGYIQDDQIGGSLPTSGGLKAGGPLDPTPTITTAGSQDTSVFYRYITTSELQDLQENPVLSPGES